MSDPEQPSAGKHARDSIDLGEVPPAAPAAPRRRASILAAVAGVAVIAVVGTVTGVILTTAQRGPAAADAVTVPSDLLAPTSSPAPADPASALASAAASATAGSEASVASAEMARTPVACDSDPRVTVSVEGVNPGDHIYFSLESTKSGESVCADADVFVTISDYGYSPDDGSQLETGGASFFVPSMIRDWTPTWETSDALAGFHLCPGDLYVFAGSQFNPGALLSPGVHHPFPIASAANGWRGEIYGYTPPACAG